ncbi:DUF6418 domain-containing protein [Pectobacterium atrosepticum]|uniref:DUF6418 domain-containing protein n=1 Tax=Pectobacterium atrosepticum TaxID=29471 RepID=UPI0012BBE289|nr:DUF6418 domain-containing protein [Pectobacterium atrosepticum]
MAEFGGYFTEIKQFSYLTGATARNTYLAFFTLHFSYLSFNFFKRINLKLIPISGFFVHIENVLMIFLYLLMVGTLFFIGIKYGHPNDYGVDRFYYWNNIAPKWGQSLIYFVQLFIIFLGRMFAISKDKKYIFFLMLGLLSFYMTGDKFTGIFNAVILFFIPIFILSEKKLGDILFNKKFITIISFFIFSLMLLTYFSYLFIYSGDSAKAIEMIAVRLFLQAQMWWAVDSVSNINPKDITVILQGFIGIFSDSDSSGIYFLMRQVAPASVFYTMLDEGVAFTMAYPPNLTYFFGSFFSIFFAIVCGVIMGGGLSILHKTIISGSAILLPMSTALYYGLVQAFLMGNISHLMSIRFLLALFVILIFTFISNSSKFRKI